MYVENEFLDVIKVECDIKYRILMKYCFSVRLSSGFFYFFCGCIIIFSDIVF